MKSKSLFLLAMVLFLSSPQLQAQEARNRGSLQVYKNEFYEEIKKASKDFFEKEKEPKKVFKVDFTGLDLPKSKEEFTYYWHNDPVSQGNTGTCWSFSTTSFLESEIYRINKESETFRKTTLSIGNILKRREDLLEKEELRLLGSGSESNAVTRM
jgi:bleomycin hydrolase